jgi:predicted ATP-grasp superfamily ATP-dependent carboligase
MKVFLYEYTCAAGAGVPGLPPSLCREGWAMLRALAEDFARVPGIELVLLLDERCPAGPAGALSRRCRAQEEPAHFRELAATAAWTVVIAPESDGLLASRCRWTVEAGGRLLGPEPDAVELTGDKLALSRHLRARGVPTPESVVFGERDPLPVLPFPAVWKPRHGAGSQATFRIANEEQLSAGLRQARSEGYAGEGILQPFFPGLPVSVAFLIGPTDCLALLPGRQLLTDDGRFCYQGGSLPLPPVLGYRAVELASRAVAVVPGLRGYVGVDLVLGDAPGGETVIEINPRLTTSYIGLRALAQGNLAELLLHVAGGSGAPPLRWRDGTVEFSADGTCRQSE